MSDPQSGSSPLVPLLCGAVVLLAAAAAGSIYGRGAAALVGAGGVLLLAIQLFWISLQSLTGEAELTLEEALDLATPSAEEERKQSTLRMLKDLEYERAVGKISEQDYQTLSTRYRAEAKRLLRVLDDSLEPARERAEQKLSARLAEQALDSEKKEDSTDSPAQPDAEAEEPTASAGPSSEEKA